MDPGHRLTHSSSGGASGACGRVRVDATPGAYPPQCGLYGLLHPPDAERLVQQATCLQMVGRPAAICDAGRLLRRVGRGRPVRGASVAAGGVRAGPVPAGRERRHIVGGVNALAGAGDNGNE